jgi:small multidrug resistance pump
MFPYYAALAVGIVLGIAGQIVLKAGSARTTDVVAQFLNPFTIIGFFCYGLAAFFYIAAIKKIPVSVAYPSVSIGYAIVAFTAHYVWGEPFGLQHIAGLVLISGGILLLYL